MPLPVFEHAYLLQSIGWAIANSFWQTGIIWLLYQFITTIDKRLPALVKHHLSIVLLFASFIWFVFTIVQNYRLLTNGTVSPDILLNEGWILRLQPFNNTLPCLSIVYLLLGCFHIVQFYKNLSVNRTLQMQGLTRPPVDIRLFTAKTALHLGIKKKIRVWLSEHVDVPSVIGFIKPVILLPASIVNHLSFQQTEAILLHELAHIKRNDCMVNFIQSLIEMILFFNPFAILLSKAVKKERENCCDDWVMNFQYDQYEYAKALMVLEEQRHLLQYRFALTATNGKKNLLQRVKRLFNTDPQTDFSFFQKFKLISLCFLLFTAIFSILPYMIHKPGNKTRINDKKEKLNLVNFDKLPGEISSKKIFTIQPIEPVNEKPPVAVSNRTKKQSANVPSWDYVNAFINEELLNPVSQMDPIVTHVIEKEINTSKYLVKIEEQQSGKKQTNTYYFELNNKGGNAAIKPLMMLNRIKVSPKKTDIGNLPDSLDTSTKPNNKKRITS